MLEGLPEKRPTPESMSEYASRKPQITSLIKIDELLLLHEAEALEEDVKVAYLECQGERYSVFHGKEEVRSVVPEGFVRIAILRDKPDLSDFWNTFEALRAFEQTEKEKGASPLPNGS